VANLGFDAFWRDHGAQKGLKGLGDEAERTHGKWKRFSAQTARDARSLGGHFRKLDQGAGAGLGNVARGLGKVGGAAAKFAGGAALAFGTATAAAIGFGVKVASGNEQARISFTTMLGSAQKADKFLRELQAFAAKTPFEFPELQTAASSLISAGINANKVIPIMTTLGNVTSGMGTGAEGVRRATIALQQMAAAGRITGEDLNQLRDAGIPVYDLLAKATGKSKAEVVKLAQAGKLGQKELSLMMKALEEGKGLERFAGLMDKQSQSLSGMWSTFKDVFGQGMAGVMNQFMPMMKSGLADVSAGASQVFGWFNRNQKTIGSVFSSASTILGSFGRIAKATLGVFISSMTQSGTSLKDFADYLRTNQASIIGGFVGFAKGAIEFGIVLGKVLSTGLRAFGGFADGVGRFVSSQIDWFGLFLRGATKAFGWMPGIGPKLKTLDANFADFANNARANMTRTGDGARGIADKIDNSMVPALTKAGRKLDEVARKEIVKAQMRDAVAKASQTIRDLGNKADGSQIKLKKFADISKLSSREQLNFYGRLGDVRERMLAQAAAGNRAGNSQAALTKRWLAGRDALYREFRQMGLSEKAAKDLAARYTKIPKHIQVKHTTPGAKGAIESAKELKRRIDQIKNKSVKLSMQFRASATKAAVSFFKTVPGSQASGFVNSFGSFGRATGGPILGHSPHSKADNILLRGTAGEWVHQVSAVDYYGHNAMRAINERRVPKEALQGYADGGEVRRHIAVNVSRNRIPGAVNRFRPAGYAAASDLGGDAVRSIVRATLKELNAIGGGGVTGPAGPMTSWHGGRFTTLAARNLRLAERRAGVTFHVFQGGWRPRTSYSGTSHAGDAVDTQAAARVIRAIRSVGWASGDRTGLGNWGSHAHSVPSPRTGRARGSAVGQYRDYVRRGGARQGLRSPWGLERGGLLTANVAEKGPERLLPAETTRTFDRMVGIMQTRGIGNTTVIINAPNYVGSRDELREAMLQMVRTNRFQVLTR
jgi:tape measure domain-containing protein